LSVKEALLVGIKHSRHDIICDVQRTSSVLEVTIAYI